MSDYQLQSQHNRISRQQLRAARLDEYLSSLPTISENLAIPKSAAPNPSTDVAFCTSKQEETQKFLDAWQKDWDDNSFATNNGQAVPHLPNKYILELEAECGGSR